MCPHWHHTKKKGIYEEKNRWIAIIVSARTKEK